MGVFMYNTHSMNDYLKQYGTTDRFLAEAALFEGLHLARVIAQYKGLYRIVTREDELLAEISGKMRHEITERALFPTVGDFVMVSLEDGQTKATIHHVLTRKSMFSRKAVGQKGEAQVISANIDTVFICMSLNNNYNISRLERYLSVAWDSGGVPVIVLTKTDLCETIDEVLQEVNTVSAFSDIICVSKFDDNVEQNFLKYFEKGITAVFIGSSGVGKSTLINKILGDNKILTAEISKGDKGKHTTTGKEMFPCPLGGVLIDTPGMRELGIEGADISTTFNDIEELTNHCSFSNCSHTVEKGCAVLEAIDKGLLDQRRFNNYLKLLNETSYEGLSSKELEKKKLERMFKDVGGMKKMRKFMKDNKNH